MKKIYAHRNLALAVSKKFGLLLLAIGFGTQASAQHQIHQSQYMHHQAFINPASIVSFNSLNAAMYYKNQWTGFTGAPTMQGISIGKPLKGYNAAWGAQIFHDKIGVNNFWQIGGTYAYKVRLQNNTKLGFGLSPYLNMQQSDFAEVQTTVANDPVFAASTKTTVMPNFRFGTYLYNDNFYLGLAIPNLLQNQVILNGDPKGETSFNASDMHLFVHAGYNLELGYEAMFTPSVLVKHVAGSPVQFDINLNAKFLDKVGVGLTYRSSQEMVIMAGYDINEEFMVGYSYDIGFSDLSLFNSGSHEIMVRYKIRTSYRDDNPVKDVDGGDDDGGSGGGKIDL